MDVFRARRQQVQRLIDQEHAGVQAAFADRIDRSANYVSRMLSTKAGHKNIGEALARLIEERHGKPVGWLDGRADAPAAAGDKEGQVLFGVRVSREAVLLAAEWEKLEPGVRDQVRTLIETMVAAQIRGEKSKAGRGHGAAAAAGGGG